MTARRPLPLVALLAFAALAGACRFGLADSAAGAPASPALSPPALAAARGAFAAYEEIRERLAEAHLDGLDAPARRLVAALDRVAGALPAGDAALQRAVAGAGRAAAALEAGGDLAAARRTFGELSRELLALAAREPRLREGRRVYTCPMTPTFNRWFQTAEKKGNPYMGPQMADCGTDAAWDTAPAPPTPGEEAPRAAGEGGGDVAYYTCSMHPSVHRSEPGTCPICSMDLVPVTREELTTGTISVPGERRQLIGVKTAPVRSEEVTLTLHADGKVKLDQTRLTDITPKHRGWVGRLAVDRPGQRVERGEVLFTLYSPELYSAEQELLALLESQRAARATSAPHRVDDLVAAARERLRLWDLRDSQLDRLEARREAEAYVAILSPVSGYVIEKNVVAGAAVEPGARLLRIAGLDRVWVEVEVFESDLPRISVGDEATVTLPYLPGRRYRGRVSFVYPYLDPATRSGTVRIELANPDLDLRPDMYADVELAEHLGRRLVVPESAVLFAGPRRVVFLDLGGGRLRPREIEVEAHAGDLYTVRSGLAPGDVVVTSGNFLIAAESRLKSAEDQW